MVFKMNKGDRLELTNNIIFSEKSIKIKRIGLKRANIIDIERINKKSVVVNIDGQPTEAYMLIECDGKEIEVGIDTKTFSKLLFILLNTEKLQRELFISDGGDIIA